MVKQQQQSWHSDLQSVLHSVFHVSYLSSKNLPSLGFAFPTSLKFFLSMFLFLFCFKSFLKFDVPQGFLFLTVFSNNIYFVSEAVLNQFST